MKTSSAKVIGINLLLINSFVYIASSVYGPFLSAYFSTNGMNSMQIGVLFTISPVASIFIQPLWAMVSDKTGRRKAVLALVVLGSGLSIFSFYLGNTFLIYFIATMIFSLFVTSIVPLSDAIIIREANKFNLDFAVIRMGGTLGFAITVVIAGKILKNYPTALYLMGFLGYMALLVFILRLKEDPLPNKKAADVPKELRIKARGLFSIFNSRMIIFVLAFALISQVGLSFFWSFLGVYLLDLGYGQTTLGWLNAVSALSELPTLIFINRLMKKFGPMKILFASCIILSIRIFLVTLGSLSFIVVAQLLQGISYMTIYFSCAVYINDNVKPGKQSQGQSSLAIVQTGVGSIIGNIAGGYLVDLMGITSAYAFMASAMVITALFIIGMQLLFKRKLRNPVV